MPLYLFVPYKSTPVSPSLLLTNSHFLNFINPFLVSRCSQYSQHSSDIETSTSITWQQHPKGRAYWRDGQLITTTIVATGVGSYLRCRRSGAHRWRPLRRSGRRLAANTAGAAWWNWSRSAASSAPHWRRSSCPARWKMQQRTLHFNDNHHALARRRLMVDGRIGVPGMYTFLCPRGRTRYGSTGVSRSLWRNVRVRWSLTIVMGYTKDNIVRALSVVR